MFENTAGTFGSREIPTKRTADLARFLSLKGVLFGGGIVEARRSRGLHMK